MRNFTQLLLVTALFVAGTEVTRADNATLSDLEAAYGTTSAWRSSVPASYPVEVKDGTIFGSDASSQTTNANVNNYDYLYVTVTDYTANKAVRIFFWDTYQNKRLDYYLKPVADKETANYEAQTDITANGTYCVKIPDGARLQGAKPAWGSSSDVSFKFSEIYLTERATPYVELVPYTLVWTPNSGSYRATIPLSESHIRTAGGVSINYSTGVVNCTGSGSLTIYLNSEDLVGATGYNLTTSDESLLGSNLGITDAVNGEVGGIYGSRNSWYIAGDASRKNKIGAVTAMKYNFDASGSWTITSIYFDADQLIAQTTNKNLTDMPYGRWGAPANVISQYIDVDSYKTNNIDGNAHNEVLYGHDGNGDANKYVDLTNCSKIIFTGFSANGAIRLFYNWSGTDADKPIETITDFPRTNGTYVFDIDAFKKAKGITFFHLNGIKSNWENVTLSSVTVEEYTNVISGSGIDRTKNYRLNPYITSINATGITAATDLTLSNPNCLIVANAGMVTNASNVIVDGVCANFVLNDGYPFKAPSAFTANSVSYDRSFPANTTTVCLPFALTSDEASSLGTFYGLSSFDGSTLTFTSVAAPEANKPYLVVPTSTSLSISGKSIAATPASLTTSVTNVEFIGTLAATTLPANDASYDYYAYNNGTFVKIATTAATLPAFRAYFKVAKGSSVKSFNIQFEDVDAIDSIQASESKGQNEIYNLAGQRMNKLQKGVNIVNGKKYIIK